VVGVGVPLLAACLALGRALAGFERDQAAALLDVHVAHPQAAPRALRARLADPVAWRSLAWLALRCVLAGSATLLLAVCGLIALAALAVPFDDGWLQWSGWSSPSGPLMLWTLLGLPVVAAAALAGLDALAAVGSAAAPKLLGGGPEAQVAALTRRTAQLGERARLAAQLHDSVGHTMTASMLQAAAARRTLDRDPRVRA
jgi:signal transduction histidine kinase